MSEPMRRCHRPADIWTCAAYADRVAALTAEVERLEAQRDEAVALLIETRTNRQAFTPWRERRDALLADLAPQEAARPCFCGQPEDRERVHRAQACEWWRGGSMQPMPNPYRPQAQRPVEAQEVGE